MVKNVFFVLVFLLVVGVFHICLAQNSSNQELGTQGEAQKNTPYDWSNTDALRWDTDAKEELKALTDFKETVRQKILDQCTYPPLKDKQPDRSVELILGIDEKGMITELDINKSSGHKQFDAAFMLAAKKIPIALVPPANKPIRLFLEFKQSELSVTDNNLK